MKTKEELNGLKEGSGTMSKKSEGLADEDLMQICGGTDASKASSITDAEAKAVEKMAGSTQTEYEKWSNGRRA